MKSCIFCAIVAGEAPAEIVYESADAIGIVPLNPVTPGHLLAIPKEHYSDFTNYWPASAATMHAAFEMARELHWADTAYNIITSEGADATQTVFHLHVHLVPRRPGDGLLLPWSTSPHIRTEYHDWTQHGHACCSLAHLPTANRPKLIARCGGPVLCKQCAIDAGLVHAMSRR